MNSEEKKVIKLLAERKLKKSKTRNKMTIIAIAFITMLYIISFTIGIVALKVIQNNYHLKNVTIIGIPILSFIKTIAVIMIIFIGYLTIYNIFNISLEKDVQFYGLLKLVGATRKQIFRILYRELSFLVIIGITAGSIIGFILASFIIPKIIIIFIPLFRVEISVRIYIFAAIFSFISSFISMLNPAIKVAYKAPVKSVVYLADFPNENKILKKGRSGGKIYRMAWRNIWRKNQKTLFTIIAISVSLMFLHAAYILVTGMSAEKYTDAMINSDFGIGTNKYFESGWGFNGGVIDIDDSLSQISLDKKVINNIKNAEGFKEGGAIYLNADFPRKDKDVVNVALRTDKLLNKSDDKSDLFSDNEMDKNGNYYIDLYGVDDFPLSKLELIDGKLDNNKLKTGKYIIYALPADYVNQKSGYNKKADYFNVGDTVTLLINNKECKYQIMAKVVLRQRTGIRFNDNRQINFYLPSNEFLKKIDKSIVMSYLADAQTGKIKDMETEIKKKSEMKNSNFTYQSRKKLVYEFWNEGGVIILILVFGGIIFGIIGILNFVNSIISSILGNTKEIAILKSIGMTSRQISKMICFESIYFTLLLVVSSLLFIAVGDLVIREILTKGTWFYTYKFDIYQIVPTYPLSLFFAIFFREVAYRYLGKKNLAEELKK